MCQVCRSESMDCTCPHSSLPGTCRFPIPRGKECYSLDCIFWHSDTPSNQACRSHTHSLCYYRLCSWANMDCTQAGSSQSDSWNRRRPRTTHSLERRLCFDLNKQLILNYKVYFKELEHIKLSCEKRNGM